MRRFVWLVIVSLLFAPTLSSSAQEESVLYQNEALGISFQYPAAWTVTERADAQTVMVGSRTDLEIIESGQKPAGAVFTVTMTSFRQLGIENVAQLDEVMAKVGGAVNPIKVGGVDGLTSELRDTDNDVTIKTAIMSVGERRVALVRGLATQTGWLGGGRDQVDQILGTLNFFPTSVNAGLAKIGLPVWQLATPDLTNVLDVTLDQAGTTLYVSEVNKGVFTVSTAGSLSTALRPAGIGAFGSFGLLRDGTTYYADPANGVIWSLKAEGTEPRKFIGAKGNVFSANSPRQFAFGLEGRLLAIDDDPAGARIIEFSRGGVLRARWDLAEITNTTLDRPVLAIDDAGNVYVTARNAGSVIKLYSDGTLAQADIGRAYLADTAPTAIIIDRFDNILVATEDKGILKFDPTGALIGVIGQPYDQAAEPKLGQLGRPVALAVSADGNLLYVVDSGKFPQIVSFAVDNNLEINVTAGTVAAGKIIYGDSASGTISATSFVYEYTFAGRRNDKVTITAQAGDPSTLDTYIELISPKDKRLAANDDAGTAGLAPTDAQIAAFTLPTTGEYTIRVTRFGRETTNATGTFTLRLDRLN